MSECLGHTTSLPGDDVAIRLGRVGRPFRGTEIRVVDENGRLVDVQVPVKADESAGLALDALVRARA